MRLNEAERGRFQSLRDVSDLRTQYQCEYRLHLKQKMGETLSDASVTGSILHRIVTNRSGSLKEKRDSRWVAFIIIVVTLIAGILWILW